MCSAQKTFWQCVHTNICVKNSTICVISKYRARSTIWWSYTNHTNEKNNRKMPHKSHKNVYKTTQIFVYLIIHTNHTNFTQSFVQIRNCLLKSKIYIRKQLLHSRKCYTNICINLDTIQITQI